MSEATRTSTEFVDWPIARHPGLAPILDEHLDDYYELLAHVLFGDVTRYAADLAGRAPEDAEADAQLLRLLIDLDETLLPEGQGDDPVDNLVWVSFVENASTDADEPLRSRLRSSRTLLAL
jgi:hypothetical protein